METIRRGLSENGINPCFKPIFITLFCTYLPFFIFTLYIIGMFNKVAHKTFQIMNTASLIAVYLLFSLASGVWAQDENLDKPVSDVEVFRPEKRDTKVQLVDSTKNNAVTLNVDIFADGIVGSYYILWDDVDLSEDIKKQMTTRDFARDEFFMQNIDREQFEQERLLQLFEDKKKQYFAIFPEEALKMLEDQQKDQ